jgi:Lon protease-like protein
MEIPLFPLPNLVLFPQVAVPLHIFEERYKLMINRCIDQADVFGLVLLREDAAPAEEGEEPSEPAETAQGERENGESEETIHRVGVTARVVQVERLDDGRMNVLCAGESRFRIMEFTGRAPYWTAVVEFFEDDQDPEDQLRAAYERAGSLYRQAMELMSELKETEIPASELPDSPLALSYMVSYVLDLPAVRKQELLETTSTFFRLEALSEDLERAVLQLRAQIARKALAQKAKTNGDLGKPH